jgi:WD40 repeat protein
LYAFGYGTALGAALAAVVAIVALFRASRSDGPHAFVLWLLAASLLEPLVACIAAFAALVAGLYLGAGVLPFIGFPWAILTAALLLAPVLGLSFDDRFYRRRCLWILGAGALRLFLYLGLLRSLLFFDALPVQVWTLWWYATLTLPIAHALWGCLELKRRLWTPQESASRPRLRVLPSLAFAAAASTFVFFACSAARGLLPLQDAVFAMLASREEPEIGWDLEGRRGYGEGPLVPPVVVEPLMSLRPPQHEFSGLALSPTGMLASAGRVWLVGATRPLGSYPHDRGAVAWSPGGTVLATSDPASVHLWRADRTIASQPASNVRALAFSSNGLLAGGSADGSITVWDVDAEQSSARAGSASTNVGVTSFGAEGSAPSGATLFRPAWTRKGHGRAVHDVCFSRDGKIVASAGVDGTVVLWPVSRATEPRTITAHTGAATSVAFTPDGRTLITGGWETSRRGERPGLGTIKLWRVEDGSHQRTLSADGSDVRALAIHPGGDLLLASGEGGVRLWRIRDGAVRLLSETAADRVAVSSDGRVLVASSRFKLESWRLDLGEPAPPALVAFAPPSWTMVTAPGEVSGFLWRDGGGRETSVIPAMTVRFEREDGSLARETTSDGEGRYRVTLPSGRYEVTTSRTGYYSHPNEHGNGNPYPYRWVPAGTSTLDLVFFSKRGTSE